eukprot:15437754-Alexandrium_andersonii.AAC.2
MVESWVADAVSAIQDSDAGWAMRRTRVPLWGHREPDPRNSQRPPAHRLRKQAGRATRMHPSPGITPPAAPPSA